MPDQAPHPPTRSTPSSRFILRLYFHRAWSSPFRKHVDSVFEYDDPLQPTHQSYFLRARRMYSPLPYFEHACIQLRCELTVEDSTVLSCQSTLIRR